MKKYHTKTHKEKSNVEKVSLKEIKFQKPLKLAWFNCYLICILMHVLTDMQTSKYNIIWQWAKVQF